MCPEKELTGSVKVWLGARETGTVTIVLDRASLACYVDLAQEWVAEAGESEVLVGSSSREIRAKTAFTLSASVGFGGPEKAGTELSVRSPLHQLLASDEAMAILERHVGMTDSPQMGMAERFSLEQGAGFAPDVPNRWSAASHR